MNKFTHSFTTARAAEPGSARKLILKVGPFGGVILALSAICLIWFGTFYLMGREKADVRKTALSIADNLSRAFEEQIVRSVSAVDQTLLYARDSYVRNQDRFDISLWSSQSKFTAGISFQLAIIGADGLMIASNIPDARPGLDLSDREHFKIHKLRPTDELFISKPVLGRASRKWSIQFSRPIIKRDGKFGGVIVVSVDPEYLGRFYETINIGEKGVISLIGTDGIVRARGSQGHSAIGDSVSSGPLLSMAATASEGDFSATDQSDGVRRLFVFRKVKAFPLLVTIGMAESEIFSQFEKDRSADILYACLLSAWLLAIAALMRRYEITLRVSKDAAESGTRARSEFLAMMSHEIRTPLNGVIGMADVMLAGCLNREQQTHAAIIRESAQHLLTILNDVLDFSKIESGHFKIEKIRFGVHETISSASEPLRRMAEEKGLYLRVEIDANVPRFLIGDPVRLRQVLFNLMSNAIKFTKTGGVTVAISAVSADAAVELHVGVTDTGIGIPADGLPLLFREFSHIDGTVARKFGGTGLGLAICKRLVEMQGGVIAVESEVGKGTQFSFFIACGISHVDWKEEEQLPVVAAPPLALPDARPSPKILLAEDNKTNQIVITKLLGTMGLLADVVANGTEAVNASSRTNYDIILMDVMMPEMDGLTATREIRRLQNASRDAKILAITASAQTDDREACLAAGMDGFLTKPVTRASLHAKLSALVKEMPNVTIERPALDSVDESKRFNESVFTELAETLGPADFAMVVQTFLADAPERLQAMRAAAFKDDRFVIKREAHALKSAAGLLGLTGFSALASDLDRSILDMPQAAVGPALSALDAAREEAVNWLYARSIKLSNLEMEERSHV